MTRTAVSTLSRIAAVVAAAGLAAGCSLTPHPTEELSQARLSVAHAMRTAEAGVAEVKRAQDKVALAQRWVDAKDYGPARWLAEQADVDAELALARASSNEARRTLARLQDSRAAVVHTSYPRVSNPTEKAK